MSRLASLGALALLGACTPLDPPTEEPAAPPPQALATVEVGPQPATTGEEYWQWDVPEEVLWAGPKPIAAHGRFKLSAQGGSLSVSRWINEGSVLWVQSFPADSDNTGALTNDGERVYVAHHRDIASGCRVTALDARSGEVEWTVALYGLGPIDHSQYHNDVQLSADGDELAVFGWEAAGRYAERLDKSTGQHIETLRVDDVLAEIPFSAGGLHGMVRPKAVKLWTENTTFLFNEAEDVNEQAKLERVDHDKRVVWTRPLDGDAGCGTASMIEIGTHLFVVRYCFAGSGARLLDVDPETGRVRVDRPLRALGPVAHSEYFSRIYLSEVKGHLVVAGIEAQGRYIEVVDPTNGRTKVSKTDRRSYVSR